MEASGRFCSKFNYEVFRFLSKVFLIRTFMVILFFLVPKKIENGLQEMLELVVN